MREFLQLPVGEALPWLDGQGPDSDIVISSRGRLLRNLRANEFPAHAKVAERMEVADEILAGIQGAQFLEGSHVFDLGTFSPTCQTLLRERHLLGEGEVLPEQHRHLIIGANGRRIMEINNQDHLRLQIYASGFQPRGILSDLLAAETRLEPHLDFAFQDEFGYLTASPVDAGTGLHLSALVHLPGLVMSAEIDKILNALRQLRFSVRGLFGGGRTVRGALFLITNLVTLGRSEEEVVSDFEFHIGKVLSHERTARQQLFAADSLGLEDLAHRSLAVVRSALLMTSQEGYDRLNHLRLGAGLGMLPELEFGLLNEALVSIQTGHLEQSAGSPLTVPQKTEARASYFRHLFDDSSPIPS